MQAILDWLISLPPAALYLVLGVTAAVENIFPPFPADTVVAFGSFIAAQGTASALGTFLSTWLGNVVGAMAMYFVGRRFGASWVEQRFKGALSAEGRFETLYGRYGLGGLFMSRFLPGLRALVPPLAGAFELPPLPVALVVALASGIWYGIVTYLGYTVGSSWEELAAAMKTSQRVLAIAAGIIVAIGLAVWLVRRRRARPS